MSNEPEANQDESLSDLLPKLLASLASGARAVNGLPVSSASGKEQEDKDDDDDFAYHMAFPEFSRLCRKSRQSLVSVLNNAALSVAESSTEDDAKSSKEEQGDEIFDKQLWDKCAETCDGLLDKVDAYVEREKRRKERGANDNATLEHNVDTSSSKFGLLLSGLVAMEKPQITYRFRDDTVQNSRTVPFKPLLHPEKPHAFVNSYEESLVLQDGHGLQTRLPTLRRGSKASNSFPRDIVAPSQHYANPYEQEIQTFPYVDQQLTALSEEELGPRGLGGTLLPQSEKGTETKESKSSLKPTGLWIDTLSGLERLSARLKEEKEIAVDLEAHSYRSFSGFLCLMQISVRRKGTAQRNGKPMSDSQTVMTHEMTEQINAAADFLVDILALRNHVNEHLAPMFADPTVVKVMHGADSDIQWLQRDFGIYVVNLFDTYRACKALKFPSLSLASLLSRYAGVEADKRHQLSDWRQRPLPESMLSYATSDTIYLLDIYDRLRAELASSDDPDVSIRATLDESRKVCLIRYDKEPFRPSGYKTLLGSKSRKGKKKDKRTVFSKRQEAVAKALYDWRDQTARDEDESIQYVCGNSALSRLSMGCPASSTAARNLVNPLPPLLADRMEEILTVIKEAGTRAIAEEEAEKERSRQKKEDGSTVEAGESGENSARKDKVDATVDGKSDAKDAGNEMDVTKGWEDRTLPLSVGNEEFDVSAHTSHSFVIGPFARYGLGDGKICRGRVRVVDGLGAARHSMKRKTPNVQDGDAKESSCDRRIEDESEEATKIAKSIRTVMKREWEALLGLQSNGIFLEDMADGSGKDGEAVDAMEETDEENEKELPIPKSLREIYQLPVSRRERRKRKKFSMPPGFAADDHKSQDSTDGDEGTPPAKRQRTSGMMSTSPGLSNKQDETPAVSAPVPPKKLDAATTKSSAEGTKKSLSPAKKVFNPLLGAPSSNPFFAGASLAGGILTEKMSGPQATQSSANRRKESGKNARLREERESNNKSFVYRTNKK